MQTKKIRKILLNLDDPKHVMLMGHKAPAFPSDRFFLEERQVNPPAHDVIDNILNCPLRLDTVP